MHNFSRSVAELVKVVSVCDSTLRKRLEEFENTPSCELTLENFENIYLEDAQNPPSFRTAASQKQSEAERLQIQNMHYLSLTQQTGNRRGLMLHSDKKEICGVDDNNMKMLQDGSSESSDKNSTEKDSSASSGSTALIPVTDMHTKIEKKEKEDECDDEYDLMRQVGHNNGTTPFELPQQRKLAETIEAYIEVYPYTYTQT